MHAYVDLSQRLQQERNTDPRAGQIGGGAAWFRFAYDLFTIRDNVKLQNVLRKKLLTGKDFQSARHELWVAALCVVAGFDLAFEDETDNTRGHTEFIATDRFSPAKIAVEAKSRHRRGVKGFKDGVDQNPGASVGVRGLVLEAYSKPKDLPLYVFVDVNLPPVADEETWNQWLGEIDTTMSDLQAEGYADPCPANIVFFCNDPSHYLISEQIGNDSDRLWIKHYEALSPRFPHPSEDMHRRFLEAHRQRLAPPSDFPEFQ